MQQFNLMEMWHSMLPLAKTVVIILGIMSVYSLWVMIDRFNAFTKAKRHSLAFILALREQLKSREVASLKKGLGGLASISSAAPFIGLFGTVVGIINAFRAMASTGQGGLGAVSAGISEALFTTAAGLLVAIPAVMSFNYFTNTIESFVVDMNEVSSELLSFVLREGRDRK